MLKYKKNLISKLTEFLKRKKESGKTSFEGGFSDIAKEAGVQGLASSTINYTIKNKFPNTFSYKGIKFKDLPNIEKEVVKLAKQKIPPMEAFKILLNKKIVRAPVNARKKNDYGALRKFYRELISQKKIPKESLKESFTPGSRYSEKEINTLDNLIKKFIVDNPDITNAQHIAKSINNENPNIKTSRSYIVNFFKRNKMDNYLTTKHGQIFPDIQKLDKIIKNNINFLTDDNINFTVKKDKILNEYIKSTKKDPAIAGEEFTSRIRKLGNLYAGTEESLRYERNKYNTIKAPKNYLNSNLQKNLIGVIDKAGILSNSLMARLLGLPKKEINLIDETSTAVSELGEFKIAGDHTDIKGLMKNFPNYKKNFTRIEYVKDSLNDFKSNYDKRIISLYNQARLGSKIDTSRNSKTKGMPIIKAILANQKEFEEKTGYRLGGFDIDSKTGKITINPLTERIVDLESPINDTLRRTMKNLGSYAAPGEDVEKFTNIVDKKLIMADSPEKRIDVLKEYSGSKFLKESKYLAGLAKVGRLNKLVKGFIGGTLGTAIPTIAFANENENFQKNFEQQKSREMQTAQVDEEMQTAQVDEYPELDNVYANASMSDVPYQANTQPQKTPITEVAEASSAAKMADDLMYDSVRKIFVKKDDPMLKANQSDILYWIADNPITESPFKSIGAVGAALSIPGAKETFEVARKADKGIFKSTASVLGKGLVRLGAPGPTALLEIPFLAKQIQEGDSAYDILSNPFNYLGPAFMESLAIKAGAIKAGEKVAERGILGGIADTLKFKGVRSPGKAAPGILNAALRLGLSPRNIALITGTGGWGTLLAGALTAGELAYDYSQGKFDDLFSSEEQGTNEVYPLPTTLDTTGIMGLKNAS